MAGSTQKPKRAAMTTSKAKKAADIAAAESKETEAPCKRRGRPPKNKTVIPDAHEDLGPGEGDDQDTPEDGKAGGAVIDWTPELTWSLVTAMEEDEDICRGLFPPPGSVKRSGAQPKKHFQWLLAQTLFEQHPQYAEVFSKARRVSPDAGGCTFLEQSSVLPPCAVSTRGKSGVDNHVHKALRAPMVSDTQLLNVPWEHAFLRICGSGSGAFTLGKQNHSENMRAAHLNDWILVLKHGQADIQFTDVMLHM
ncbi:hypothetical protein DFH09DRAFT_1069562 [Mycena vulgaris]|nr:hypothetical protein DFH09DRAFT_1069562 [Mycena vulgaris]